MEQTQEAIEFGTGTAVELMAVVVAGLVLLFLTFGILSFAAGFMKELRYLNNEIARTDGEERRYYTRCKRKLLLSLIPFVRK